MNYHHRGTASELIAAARFVERGHEVFFPIMSQSAVDFIALIDGVPKRIQVKTGSQCNPKYPDLLQVRLGGSGRSAYTADAFDYLVVVKGQQMWVYPTSVVDITQCTLSFNLSLTPRRKPKVNPHEFEWRSN